MGWKNNMENNIPKISIDELFTTNDYNIEVELPFSKKKIFMREMITADQKYFLKHASNLEDKDFVQRKIGVLFNDLLSKLIKDVDFKTMALQDKLFLLLFIRSKTKGDKTILGVKCEKCGADITFGYDMSKFHKKIIETAEKIKTPIEVPVGDIIFIVDSVTVQEEIEADALLSDPSFIKHTGIEEKYLMNNLRVASAVKRIIMPKGMTDMTEHPLRKRLEVIFRTPTASLAEISEKIKGVMEETFKMLTDKFTVPCLQKGCDGKAEAEVQIGNEGFFIPQSSVSEASAKS